MAKVLSRQELELKNKTKNYKEGFITNITNVFKSNPGLNEEVIKDISKQKNEPRWMLEKRLEAYKIFLEKPMPSWGGSLKALILTRFTIILNQLKNKRSLGMTCLIQLKRHSKS